MKTKTGAVDTVTDDASTLSMNCEAEIITTFVERRTKQLEDVAATLAFKKKQQALADQYRGMARRGSTS